MVLSSGMRTNQQQGGRKASLGESAKPDHQQGGNKAMAKVGIRQNNSLLDIQSIFKDGATCMARLPGTS